MPISRTSTEEPLSPVTITHTPSGATATVHPFGATVTSYKTSTGKEAIFVSRLAKYDGSKAIRGGIPLCFPQFGRPDESMPQHGFFRVNTWTLVGEGFDDDEFAGCEFSIKFSDVVKAKGGVWESDSRDFIASYIIKIDATRLVTTLTIKNTGAEDFTFQTLLHTYYLIEDAKALDPAACNVTGLAGYDVEDKITKETYVQGTDPIVMGVEVDRVFTSNDASKDEFNAVLQAGTDKKISLHAKANVDGAVAPVSAVVWNPHIEKTKGMGDMGDEQYHEFVCVEPGIIKNVPVLKVGKEAVFEQTVTVS